MNFDLLLTISMEEYFLDFNSCKSIIICYFCGEMSKTSCIMKKTTITLLLIVFPTILLLAQNRNPKYEAYIAKYHQLAMEKQNLHKIPASITLAQALLESGAGESKLATTSNNHFVIKRGGSWNGKNVYHDDDKSGECCLSYATVGGY